LKLWATWFCHKAKLRSEQMICFAYTKDLDAEREPLMIKDENDETLMIPVLNVNLQRLDANKGMKQDDDDDGVVVASAARTAFDLFVSKVAGKR
jgi:hypothetical protein